MHRLKEIIRVVGRRRLKRIEIFNESGKSNRQNLYYRFYHGVKDGSIKTDEEAAMALCGTDQTDKKYQMLKSRVRSRLLNTLFFLDYSGASEYEQAVQQCNRNLIAGKVLLMHGARSAGDALMRSTLTLAEKFEITDVAMNCLLQLRHAASFIGNVADFENMRKRFSEVKEIFELECLAEEYYQILVLPFAKGYSIRPEWVEQAQAYIAEIERRSETGSSYKVEMMLFRLRAIAGQIAGDGEQVLEACSRCESYLRQRRHLMLSIREGEIAGYRTSAYLHLGRYEEGRLTAKEGLKFFGEGSPNWVIYLETYFLLCMHNGSYDEASDILLKVTGHARFAEADEPRKEKWRIFEAFLHYMTNQRLGAAQGEVDTQFRLMKFLNEVPNYSKDKRGLNIAILILQVLFLLDRRDFDGIIARAEALKVYCSRYLKQDEHYRSNCFLKMMLVMEKKDFNYEGTLKHTDRYYHLLKSTRFSYQSGNMSSLEIIPYEQLWATILGKLRALNL